MGEEPIRRRSNTEEIYHYDKHTARLMACEKDAVEVMNRTYFTNGQLKTEQRSLDGTTYATGHASETRRTLSGPICTRSWPQSSYSKRVVSARGCQPSSTSSAWQSS